MIYTVEVGMFQDSPNCPFFTELKLVTLVEDVAMAFVKSEVERPGVEVVILRDWEDGICTNRLDFRGKRMV